VKFDLDTIEQAQGGHLVADEASPLRMSGIGKHVGDHQSAQDPSTVALWNDGAVASPPTRGYGRGPAEMRPSAIEPGFVRTATGSALISIGETRVICTASAQEGVPRWMAGKGSGWLTAEYGMLPASTGDRKQRDATRGRQDGRTIEIQRLIGRSLRVVVDFRALGERTIYLDCDVLQADGGTRCASITGAYVALSLACARLQAEGRLERSPLSGPVAAISCGIIEGSALLDLDYSEDSTAEVDANVVMTGEGGLVEVQATAERTPLSRAHLDELLALAAAGIERVRATQEEAIAAGLSSLARAQESVAGRP
jgi:ribonuclease PH